MAYPWPRGRSDIHHPTVLILRPPLPADHGTGPDLWFDWVRSAHGQAADEHGQSPTALLPRDQELVLVVPAHALSWHPVVLPKVPAKRLRAVLDGLLEEQLLVDTAEVHFALAPGARPGQTAWVCACDRAWLRHLLDQLEAAGRPVSRIVPAVAPQPEGTAARHLAFDAADRTWLASMHAHGVGLQPLAGTSAAAGLQAWGLWPPEQATWLADPAAVAQAERCLPDARWQPQPLAEALLTAAASPWNLAQFDLSLSAGARVGQRWRQRARTFAHDPAWRPARWGVLALLVALIGGLNTAAWLQERRIAQKSAAIEALLRESFPHVSVVLDAPAQMAQELQRLRAASGVPGPQDLEPLLAAVGRALPPGQTGPTTLDYDGRGLSLGGWTAAPEALAAVREALVSQGLAARIDGTALRVEVTQP